MRIRKLFKFENAHIVRNCSSDRCSRSLHGHSYQIELILEANRLDHGQMVYDFGLLKGTIKDLIDSFDHSVCFWDADDPEYIAACKKFSARWISLPVSPSAEQFARMIFFWCEEILKQTVTQNGEADIRVYSVIAHETATGYAQCFKEDVDNLQMGQLTQTGFEFSEQIKSEWGAPDMLDQLAAKQDFVNPQVVHQVTLEDHHD